MNDDYSGLWYGGMFILIVGCLLFTFIRWVVTPEPINRVCAYVVNYNNDGNKVGASYSQVLIKGDDKLVGLVAPDGELYGSTDFSETYHLIIVNSANPERECVPVILKNGKHFKIGLIENGQCSPESIDHWKNE